MRRLFSTVIFFTIAWVLITFAAPRCEYARREQVLAETADLHARLLAAPDDAALAAAFCERLEASDYFQRTQAFSYLHVLPSLAPRFVEQVRVGLSDANPYVRREAALAAGYTATQGRSLVPDLIAVTAAYPNADAGCFAAKALGEVASPDDQHVQEVLAALAKDHRRMMSESAARATARLNERRKELDKPRHDVP